MNYPCEIIRDLLPLYIDNICNEKSRQAIDQHLVDCEACQNYCNAMKSSEGFVGNEYCSEDDKKMVNSLKNIKNKINNRIKHVILCAVAAIAVITGGMYLLFNAPIKDVPLDEISVSANVYALNDLIVNPSASASDSESVTIFFGEEDQSPKMEVKIPELGHVTLTESVIEKCKYVSTVFVESDYFLREIKKDIKDHTMYISGFKTSVLNNKTGIFTTQMVDLEFQEINQIVLIDRDGTETILWSK